MGETKFAVLSLAHTARFLSLKTKTFVAGDENLLCAGNTYKRFLSTNARNSFSSLTTEDKISVTSDKYPVVCARL